MATFGLIRATAMVALFAGASLHVSGQPSPDGVAALIAQAQADVDTLASPGYAGRGYLKGGHDRAAAYLAREFEAAGADPVAGSFLHPFPLVTHVFPETPELSINGNVLTLGQDYIPDPGSGSGKVAHGLGADRSSNNWVAHIPAALPDSVRKRPGNRLDERIASVIGRGARAVLVSVENVTAGLQTGVHGVPVFHVRSDAIPEVDFVVDAEIRTSQGQSFVSKNVVGRIPGTRVPDSTIIVMAHYDHHGSIGDTFYFPGANDNASGTALMLSLVRHFSQRPLDYSLVFVGFSGEEKGLIGSRHFAVNPPIELGTVKWALNFDMVASGEEGIVAVGGSDHPHEFAVLDSLSRAGNLGKLGKRPNAPNSDHYFLTQMGVKAFYLYTNKGTQPYHHRDDVPDTLEWDDFENVLKLAIGFITEMSPGTDPDPSTGP